MARETVEVVRCDRCKVKIEQPYYGGEAGTYKLRFDSEYAFSGNRTVWDELCKQCNEYVGDLIAREIRALKTTPTP